MTVFEPEMSSSFFFFLCYEIQFPRNFDHSNWASLTKLGMNLPNKVPQVRFQGFFENFVPPRKNTFFVIFKVIQFPRLFDLLYLS